MKTKNYKSRDNWNLPLCLKFECKNKGKKCDTCIHFSNYEKENNENNKGNSKS